MSFPSYSKYKLSGVGWLGAVPFDWKVVPLKTVAGVVNGFPFDSKLFDLTNGFPLVRIRDLDQREPEARYGGEFVSAAAIDNDDVLIGMDGDFNVGRWRGEVPALLNQRMCCVRAPSRLHTRFIEYTLPIPLKIINDLTYATTVKHLSSFDVLSIRLALPPHERDVASVLSFLDRETAKIDALVEEQKRLIELLKEKRQAVISQAVTKGLHPTVPMKDSGVEWLGQVPAHWAVTRLRFVAEVQSGIAKGKDNTGRSVIAVPYLRVANVQDGFLDLDEITQIEVPAEDLPRYRLRAGDVLMNEGGDFDKLGRGCVWDGSIDPCIHQNHVFAVRPLGISSSWLSTLIGTAYAQFYFMSRSKQSTNLASISSTNIMELPVVIPPADERSAILAHVAACTSELDALADAADRAVELLQERRAALISAAVTGKIDVRGLVPQAESVAA